MHRPMMTNAARLHEHSQPLQIEWVELPEPGDGEVRLERECACVNPVDRYTAQGADQAIVAGPDELAEAIGALDPTVVFDPLGDGFVAPALEALSARGKLVSFGTSASPEVQLNMQTLYRKMVSVLGYGGMQL